MHGCIAAHNEQYGHKGNGCSGGLHQLHPAKHREPQHCVGSSAKSTDKRHKVEAIHDGCIVTSPRLLWRGMWPAAPGAPLACRVALGQVRACRGGQHCLLRHPRSSAGGGTLICRGAGATELCSRTRGYGCMYIRRCLPQHCSVAIEAGAEKRARHSPGFCAPSAPRADCRSHSIIVGEQARFRPCMWAYCHLLCW